MIAREGLTVNEMGHTRFYEQYIRNFLLDSAGLYSTRVRSFMNSLGSLSLKTVVDHLKTMVLESPKVLSLFSKPGEDLLGIESMPICVKLSF